MRKFRILLLVLSVSLSIQSIAQNVRVKILATGGTIAGAGASSTRAAYKAGELPIDQLLNAVPDIHKLAKVTGEQIASIGSQDMSIDIWLKIAKRINEIFKNNEADAVVITHGTDTQEETSYFLRLTVKYDKPVVLTGSMRPATAISADGPKNLYDAVVVAASPKSAGRGVLVSMNEMVFSGRDVTKSNSTSTATFQSADFGPIGLVYDGLVEYYRKTERLTGSTAPWDVDKITKLPRVDIAYMYADAPATTVNALVKEKVDGIVFAGVGNGNMNKVNLDALAAAAKSGIIVCRDSRTYSGRVTLHDEVDDDKYGFIVADDLNAQKARILLMLALTVTKDRSKLQDFFFKY